MLHLYSKKEKQTKLANNEGANGYKYSGNKTNLNVN